jgi:phenylalanyl-tRNA synthetase beta chain
MRLEIRDFLIRNGFHEIVTQNITDPVSAKLFEEDVIQIANPLGEELSVMRTSLIPSLLRVAERNHRLGTPDLRLFEIGKTFHKVADSQDTFIPGIFEKEELILAMTGKSAPKQWGVADRDVDFYDIKGAFEDMLSFFRYDNISLVAGETRDTHYSKNTLSIVYKGKALGFIGSVSKDLLKKYDVSRDVFVAVLDLSEFYNVPRKRAYYSHVSPYPGSSRDLAFMVPAEAQAGDMLKLIQSKGGQYLRSVEIFDVYSGKSIEPGKKSIAFSLYFSSPERTLVEDEVESAVNKIVSAVESKFGATLRKF